MSSHRRPERHVEPSQVGTISAVVAKVRERTDRWQRWWSRCSPDLTVPSIQPVC